MSTAQSVQTTVQGSLMSAFRSRTRTLPGRRLLALACASLLLVVVLVARDGTPASAAGNYTWVGGAPTGTPQFTSLANWSGDTVPKGAVGTLSFPTLTSAACTAEPATGTCYSATDNSGGLSATALSIDASASYFIDADANSDPLTLGSGGITETPSNPAVSGFPDLFVPLALSADQTWTINGSLFLNGAVSGTSTLDMSLAKGSIVHLNEGVDVGAVTVSGLT